MVDSDKKADPNLTGVIQLQHVSPYIYVADFSPVLIFTFCAGLPDKMCRSTYK
jgi:hypothetical protein